MTDTATPVKIVVGVNGSRSSLRALTWAHRQARLTHGDLHIVLSTWTIPVNRGWTPVLGGSDWPEPARKLLDEAIDDTLGPTGTGHIHRQVVQGHPVRALLDAASDADLLVVGSGSPPDTSTGSLCHDLVSRATCPVVVVRARPDRVEPTGPSASEEVPPDEQVAAGVDGGRR